MGEIMLERGRAFASVAPGHGGALARFWWRTAAGRIDWMRAVPDALPADMPANLLGCFPMVPFFGRIRGGRLSFGGRTAMLRHNLPGIAHAVHGHGWQRSWQVEECGGGRAAISYACRGEDWPWPYTARQEFALDEAGGLSIALSVRNDSDEPMPAGLGFHPYFPRRDGAILRADLQSVWESDEQLFPKCERPLAATEDFAAGRDVAGLDYDHVFGGWQGEAVAQWRDGSRLRISAAPATPLAVIVARPGRDFFTFEPVTHLSDSFNRGGDGTAVLPPGGELGLTLRLRPELQAGLPPV